MEVKNVLEREFVLRNYETDFARRIKPSAILGFFQETAGDHSQAMGMGNVDLAKHGFFWVLSKIYVSIERRPLCGDCVRVVTWPHEPNKAIYERSFTLNDGGGVDLRDYSRWCRLKANGRIVPVSAVRQPQMEYIKTASVCFENWQIPNIAERTEPAFSIKIANSEYDFNYHVNNIKYADYIFNCFSVQELKDWTLRNFQIHYVKQSHEGDVLRFYREEIADGEFVIEGKKNDEEVVISARVCFERN